MRRRLAAGAACALALASAAAAGGCGSGGGGDYRIDAVFDNAGFLTPDTDVRVGGAKVGKVVDMTLTRDHQALVKLSVDRRFAPFHADADCTIQSQSLISEKFVDCSPGTPGARAITAPAGRTPILPVANTHAPVDIDLVLNIFRRPERERLSLLLGALGTGLAGRGGDLNAAILRAAPALQQTRRVLDVLDADRTELRQLIRDSDTVLARLGDSSDRVAAFVRDAGDAAVVSGQRREQLAAAVHRLPALLAQARPSLHQLADVAHNGTPFARQLDAAAPGVRQLLAALGPFSADVRPTVTRLATTARRATPQLRDLAPQVRRLQRLAKDAVPAGSLLAELLDNSRQRGVTEGLGNLGYYGATALARFDKYSHILPAYSIVNSCAQYATTPTAGCDAGYAASRAQRKAFYAAQTSSRAKERRPSRSGGEHPLLPAPPRLPSVPRPPVVPQPGGDLLQSVVEGVGGLLGGRRATGGGDGRSDAGVAKILDYLLK